MPLHDWTRVDAGIFHDFHLEWIHSLKAVLNSGLLPPEYYALAEQVAGGLHSDVLTLEAGQYARKRRRITIRHRSGDDVVAMVEILSPGNKSSQHALQTFVEKTLELLDANNHMLILDLFPPEPRDPEGIHGAIWSRCDENSSFHLPEGLPLTLVAYAAGADIRAYIEPTGVGQVLSMMPLFLSSLRYVSVPLEATYQTAFDAVPRRWREVLAASA
jgi:hypothetical protein